MKNKCPCGKELGNTKIEREVTVELSNPGTVKFTALAVRCDDCNKFIFSEEDAEQVFESFENARRSKQIK